MSRIIRFQIDDIPDTNEDSAINDLGEDLGDDLEGGKEHTSKVYKFVEDYEVEEDYGLDGGKEDYGGKEPGDEPSELSEYNSDDEYISEHRKAIFGLGDMYSSKIDGGCPCNAGVETSDVETSDVESNDDNVKLIIKHKKKSSNKEDSGKEDSGKEDSDKESISEILGSFDKVVSTYIGGADTKQDKEHFVYRDLAALLKELNSSEAYEKLETNHNPVIRVRGSRTKI